MNEPKSKSTKLLNKVYKHLDSIDVSTLSLCELADFLEVVQKGRFLEAIGQVPAYGFGGFGLNRPAEPAGNGEDKAEQLGD